MIHLHKRSQLLCVLIIFGTITHHHPLLLPSWKHCADGLWVLLRTRLWLWWLLSWGFRCECRLLWGGSICKTMFWSHSQSWWWLQIYELPHLDWHYSYDLLLRVKIPGGYLHYQHTSWGLLFRWGRRCLWVQLEQRDVLF